MAQGENDILIRLYGIRDNSALVSELEGMGVSIRRMMAVNTSETLAFIEQNFSTIWADEARFAMMHRNCFIAVKDHRLVGFCCVDATAPGFLGPIGVLPEMRGHGIARALLYKAMLGLKDRGYKYAVAGMVREDFARNILRNWDAMVIPDSAGSYEDMIDPSIA